MLGIRDPKAIRKVWRGSSSAAHLAEIRGGLLLLEVILRFRPTKTRVERRSSPEPQRSKERFQ